MEQFTEQQLRTVLADLAPEDVHAVVAFAHFLNNRRHPMDLGDLDAELSEAEQSRIVGVLDEVTALSQETGPPENNRNHDLHLYRDN